MLVKNITIFCEGKKNNVFKSFSIVELIVVISLIAVISVITVLSVFFWIGKSRDTNRISQVSQINKSLDIFYTRNNFYPDPDGDISVGNAMGVYLIKKGVFGETASMKVGVFKETIKDPGNSSFYTYSLAVNQKNYQIGYIIESKEKLFSSFLDLGFKNSVYAAGEGRFGGVEGFYKGVFNFSVGNQYYSANFPSLIWANTGNVNLLSSGMYYVVNRNKNLPYSIINEPTQNITIGALIQDLNNVGTALTAVNITDAIINKVSLTNIITGDKLKEFGGTGMVNKINISDINIGKDSNKCIGINYSGYILQNMIDGQIGFVGKDINIPYGKNIFSLKVICNNGLIVYSSETENTVCDENYIPSSYACILDNCGGTIPLNAEANGSQGTSSWTYSLQSGVCKYKCQNNYTWNGTNACIDLTPPVIYTVVSSSSTCNSIRITVSAADAIQMNASSYSFDGGNTWQSSNIKDYVGASVNISANQIKVRDNAGNVSSYTGTINGVSASCSCSLPWGGTLNNGESITAYYSNSVNYPSGCSSQTRSCSNGLLNGSYQYSSCSVNYTYSWVSGGWGSCSGGSSYWGSRGGCSVSCGGGTQYRYCQQPSGYQYRTVYCQRNDGVSVSDAYCGGGKPSTSTSCSADLGGCGYSSYQSTSCNTQVCPGTILGGASCTLYYCGGAYTCGGGPGCPASTWVSYGNCGSNYDIVNPYYSAWGLTSFQCAAR